MANRSSDFNYKVALASGLKSLQGGRLRAAEEQFRYLVKHFPMAEGGYRGLAKVLVEQEDRNAAVRTLLEGGAALAKADQRALATQLYREAVTLDENDLAAHRRLAAALTLAGQKDEAAFEYVRFIENAQSHGDDERAKLEMAYACERLPGDKQLEHAAERLGVPTPQAPATKVTSESSAPTWTPAQPARETSTPHIETATERWSDLTTPMKDPTSLRERPTKKPAQEWAIAEATPERDPWAAAHPTQIAPIEDTPKTQDTAATEGTAAREEAGASETKFEREPAQVLPADADAVTAEAISAEYLANGDKRGGQAALEAARRYIADGRMDAASDLLLQLIASGIARHDAQRLLVDVTKSMGKSDLTQTKLRLLVEALRLDGRAELAAEVEQAAQAD